MTIDIRSIEERKSVYDHFEPDEIEPNVDTKAEAYEEGRGNGFEDGQEYGYDEGMTAGNELGRKSVWAQVKGLADTHTIDQMIESMEASNHDLREVEPAAVDR